ncbi:hypothetical protein M422DRAFT_242823 [Sphaerobolus stellatus SS14]|nr:hypothetical protein M422DRAFT_242823 [Sphaerobolus stellatus SS14]
MSHMHLSCQRRLRRRYAQHIPRSPSNTTSGRTTDVSILSPVPHSSPPSLSSFGARNASRSAATSASPQTLLPGQVRSVTNNSATRTPPPSPAPHQPFLLLASTPTLLPDPISLSTQLQLQTPLFRRLFRPAD